VHLIQIDVVGLQTRQAFLDGLHDSAAGSALASFVLAEDGVAILKCEQFGLSELRGDDHLLAFMGRIHVLCHTKFEVITSNQML